MDDNRWIMNRAGLINFWYYDEEEFQFSDGKLLLRGANGSGKSVTMQSFIPLLLDGNKSPERLDPFGSKARKMENYLLGDENQGKDENLAYLYMEFLKKPSGKTLTIGLGFKAVRGKPLKFWGFAINDGRRIGKDFFLYKDIGEKIPLTMKELQNRIGEGGKVVERQKEYMKMVNDLLFGFSELDDYEELIKLLIQLRSPKLSKDFKPTVIYEIMENSLQPLSEEDLRPMSEAIENMDNIKSRLEELKESKKSGDKIKNAYDKYNRFILREKAHNLVGEDAKLRNTYQEKERGDAELLQSQESYLALDREKERLSIELETVKKKKKELEQNDSLQIKEKIVDIEAELKKLKEQISDKENQLQRKKEAERKNDEALQRHEGQKEKRYRDIVEHLEELENCSMDFAFDEHSFFQGELENKMDEKYDFTYIKSEVKKIIEKIEKALAALEEQKRKNKDHDEALGELEEAKSQRNELWRNLDACRNLLSEMKDEYMEKIHFWKEQNHILKIADDVMKEVSRSINNFDVDSDFGEISEAIRQEYYRAQSEINKKSNGITLEMQKWEKAAEDKEHEIKTWEAQEDPEPPRKEETTLFRKRLEEQGIPYVPLYKAIDFQEGVSEEQKGIIEEALLEMGLLDALVVPERFRDKIRNIEGADKFIQSHPKVMTYNLSSVLKVDRLEGSGITAEDVSRTLLSIMVDPGTDTYIDEKGFYGLGILKGKVSKDYQPKFIGIIARRNYREEKIRQLKVELELLGENIQKYRKELDLLSKDQETLNAEFQHMPKNDDLMTAINEVKKAEFSYTMSLEKVEEKGLKEKAAYEALKLAREKVHELTHKLQLKPTLAIFEEALAQSKAYQQELYELETTHYAYITILESIASVLSQKEDIEIDLDNLLYDRKELSNKEEGAILNVKDLRDQLAYTNYEEIRDEIDRCVERLERIPKEQLQRTEESANEKAKYKNLKERLQELQEKTQRQEESTGYCQKIFLEEYRLNYVITVEEADPVKLAKVILQEVQEESGNRQGESFSHSLFKSFQENAITLRDYSVSLDEIFDDDVEDTQRQFIRQRNHITAKVRGKKVSFYELMDFIDESIVENEELLRESDRQLFEDILVKNISKKIKAKIFHSEKWVERMNTLMKSMNTSSGLSFSLQWTSKKAETEEQIDTKELVGLLKQDANLMRVEDLDKMSEHFRSKIALARRATEDNSQNTTFHSIMRDVLDYRKWFEFKLYYVKTGQPRRELTNNAFYQFSGGEKAMAMYVPLFSAVNARYQGGRKDCPRIISLDEAFAGVDEQNIRDMFRLLNELDLGYIMNSQNLWGDYDTVPSLSICELYRPDNADFVTVLRYHWDGKVKEMIV